MNLKALLAVIFLSACFATTAVAAPAVAPDRTEQHGIHHAEIEGHEWRIAQYYVHQVLLSPHPQLVRVPSPYISFADGTIQGSPGCGRFTGTYRRADDALTISAKWSDDARTPCNGDEKSDAAKMLEALSNVRRIGDPPSYWHDDALLLTNSKGDIEVALSPRQAGNDLSDLHDPYWHLLQMSGFKGDLSQVIIKIDYSEVSFSTPACYLAFPFEYEMSGLKFYPAWSRSCSTAGRDWHLAQVFERGLHSINSYQQTQGTLTFFDKGQHPIMVLHSIRSTDIETRVWRIEKYRTTGAQFVDKNGLTEAKILAIITLVNGGVGGGPGCGAWVGTYKLSGDRLTLHAGVALGGLCQQAEEVQSHSVEKAFQGDLQIEQANDHILLRDENGQAQILLVPF